MERNKIILISALIIGVFAVLFLIENPQKPPKNEIEDIIKSYRGKPGFLIVALPKFLISEFIPANVTDIETYKKGIHKVKILIFHEKDNKEIKTSELHKRFHQKLDSINFQTISDIEEMTASKQLYRKKKYKNWNESVLIFSNDSSLFLFDIISNLDNKYIKLLSDSIQPVDINFN